MIVADGGDTPDRSRGSDEPRSTATASLPGSSARPAVAARHVSKRYPGVRALDDVSLDLFHSEIHALLGGNGSGKSTFVKVLAGIELAESGGSLSFDGQPEVAAEHMTPVLAHKHGVRVVHQDLGLFPTLTVMENLAIGQGFERTAYGRVNWRMQRRKAATLIDKFEIKASPSTVVGALGPVAQTQLAIARALQDQEEGSAKGVLILDEPTSALAAHEVDLLFGFLRRYAAGGQAIVYISHRLQEILDLTHRVSILRDGRHVATRETQGLDEAKLAELVVARNMDTFFETPPSRSSDAAIALKIDNMTTGRLEGIDLEVGRGEIVGIAGLVGSGRSTLLRTIFGDISAQAGGVTLAGRRSTIKSPREAVRAGIALVPESRTESAFATLSVCENIAAPRLRSYWRRGFMSNRAMRQTGRAAMAKYLIKTSSETADVNTLSGGNQQKAVLARWLDLKPQVLLLDEPTQGVDVGARAEIYRLINAAAADGAAVLVVASDAEELCRVCHRIVVLRSGRIVSELLASESTPEKILELTG